MANEDIKKAITEAGLYQYEVCHEIGIKSEATFTRWLRYELSAEKKKTIYEAIKKLTNKGK